MRNRFGALVGAVEERGRATKLITAFGVMAIVVAAQPAGAVDDGFRGRYRVTKTPCFDETRTHPIRVRYINGRVRDYGRAGRFSRRHLEYVSGRWFQWQNDRGLKLRYRPGTDSAIGVRLGLQDCHVHVRLAPIGDDGFRGRYRLIASPHLCPGQDEYRHPATIRYISERVRELVHAGRMWSGRFRYVPGRRLPWHREGGGFALRYRARTDSARGIHEGCWRHVRLVPID